jgi:hypothetical protein
MAVRIKSMTFDCADPYRLAQFWLQLTGFSEDPGNGNAPDDPEALLLSPDGSLALLFIAVPEPKRVKNRVHLDLVPLTSRRDEEVDQLLVPTWSTTSAGQSAGDGWFSAIRRVTSSASSAVTPSARRWPNSSAVHPPRSPA